MATRDIRYHLQVTGHNTDGSFKVLFGLLDLVHGAQRASCITRARLLLLPATGLQVGALLCSVLLTSKDSHLGMRVEPYVLHPKAANQVSSPRSHCASAYSGRCVSAIWRASRAAGRSPRAYRALPSNLRAL